MIIRRDGGVRLPANPVYSVSRYKVGCHIFKRKYFHFYNGCGTKQQPPIKFHHLDHYVTWLWKMQTIIRRRQENIQTTTIISLDLFSWVQSDTGNSLQQTHTYYARVWATTSNSSNSSNIVLLLLLFLFCFGFSYKLSTFHGTKRANVAERNEKKWTK